MHCPECYSEMTQVLTFKGCNPWRVTGNTWRCTFKNQSYTCPRYGKLQAEAGLKPNEDTIQLMPLKVDAGQETSKELGELRHRHHVVMAGHKRPFSLPGPKTLVRKGKVVAVTVVSVKVN